MKRIVLLSTLLSLAAIAALSAAAERGIYYESSDRLSYRLAEEQRRYPVKGITGAALRFFAEKGDLTSVIMIIPDSTVVDIIDIDEQYYYIEYENQRGYISGLRVEVTEWAPVPREQWDKMEQLGELEDSLVQHYPVKGVTRSALRFFGERGDLTTVIMIIPAGTEIEIVDDDEEFFTIMHEEYIGFVSVPGVEITEWGTVMQEQVQQQQVIQQQAQQQVQQTAQQRQAVQQQATEVNRLSYLENKYGPDVALRIYSGRVWRGMTSGMVLDAWGDPQRINRVISRQQVQEEWIYPTTWLLIEDGRLKEWGPVRLE